MSEIPEHPRPRRLAHGINPTGAKKVHSLIDKVYQRKNLEMASTTRPVPELDDWIRRRIRMCYWKQWRWVRTKIKHLLALGVSLTTAIQHGVSSKSFWHIARTPALQQALSNAWLKAQGLVSVKDLWSKAQGYTT